jgi:hypothetical protein
MNSIKRSPIFELPEELGKIVDVKEEDNKSVVEFANKRKVAVLAIIASYVPLRVSPTEQSYAYIGTSEEFGVETALSKMREKIGKNCEVYLLLNSPGGAISSAYEIAKALRETCPKLTIFVPHVAASGGTLIALTGDRILMGRMSRLSPMDVQKLYDGDFVSANAMLRAFGALTNYFKDKSEDEAPYPWKALVHKLDPIQMQAWTDMQLAAEKYVKDILRLSNYKNCDEIAHSLVYEYSYHGDVVDYAEAKRLGLRVVRDTEDREGWSLMREWLAEYLLKSANKHFIRYACPSSRRFSKKKGP